MSTVIIVEDLGKRYFLKHQSGQQSYVALRDVLTDGVKNWGRRLLGGGNSTISSNESEEFWALKDVSFEVEQGDRIGIVGRNGAGKSTLLKILSRITEPTTGSVRIKGRVASLLEVGTGFHPELTGRENIFLNGVILGMGRSEIKKKFDEIVDFAEIERFLDTPVKRYSSGMYVRLAFAVAAHLEPEILIVDEVLAVGDARFQKKCLGKMEDVSTREGRTVLFVSHNMGAVEHLCCKALLMSSGGIVAANSPAEIIAEYLASVYDEESGAALQCTSREGLRNVEIGDIRIQSRSFRIGEPMAVSISYCQRGSVKKKIVECGMSIWSDHDVRLVSISSLHRNDICRFPDEGTVVCNIPELPLVHGEYYLNVFVSSSDGIEDYIVHAQKFRIHEADYYGSGKLVDPSWGLIVLEHQWLVQ